MAKTAGLSVKPTKKEAAQDAFVAGEGTAPAKRKAAKKEETSRLTVEIPVEMHRRLKAKCAMDGKKLNVVVTDLVEQYLR
jgi:predicted HicB family RNase H-like nuclease